MHTTMELTWHEEINCQGREESVFIRLPWDVSLVQEEILNHTKHSLNGIIKLVHKEASTV